MTLNFAKAAGVLTGAAGMAAATMASAGVPVYEEGDKFVEIGGKFQAQYNRVDPDQASSTDDFLFRRLEFSIEGTLTENFVGAAELDLGDNGKDPEVGDALIAYTGLALGDIVLGNQDVPFSREKLTSDERQQTVERQFAGDADFGVPDAQMGVSIASTSDLFGWWVGVYKAGIVAGDDRLAFDTRVNDNADYFGNMLAARVDIDPFGHVKKAQGAFGEDLKVGIGLNAYTWKNDDDDIVNPVSDYDQVTGLGIDGAVRYGYFSADAAYQSYASETRDGGYTGGLVENGDGDFETYLLKGGYMLIPNRLEGIVAYSGLDADAWQEVDKRLSTGANFFINRNKTKIQLTYEFGQDVNGVSGNDADTLYVQFQQVF